MTRFNPELEFIERTPRSTMCPLRSRGRDIVPCLVSCVFLHKTHYRLNDNTYPEVYYCGYANGIEPMMLKA